MSVKVTATADVGIGEERIFDECQCKADKEMRTMTGCLFVVCNVGVLCQNESIGCQRRNVISRKRSQIQLGISICAKIDELE